MKTSTLVTTRTLSNNRGKGSFFLNSNLGSVGKLPFKAENKLIPNDLRRGVGVFRQSLVNRSHKTVDNIDKKSDGSKINSASDEPRESLRETHGNTPSRSVGLAGSRAGATLPKGKGWIVEGKPRGCPFTLFCAGLRWRKGELMRGKPVVSLSCFFFPPAPFNCAWSYPGRGCHGPGGDPFAKRERSSLRFDGAERRSTTLSRTHWSVGLWWGTGRRSRSMPPWLGFRDRMRA